MTETLSDKINCSRFFYEWKGHPIGDLTRFREIALEKFPESPHIYLAGDSSLDNKYWVPPWNEDAPVSAASIYEQTLRPPRPKPDVAFWMNKLLDTRAVCINTAVEESMLRERDHTLLPHDKFIRDNIRAQDVLIVSVGANDVALKPLPSTIRHMLQLAWLTRRASLENASASSLNYFKEMFGTKVRDYIIRLTSVTKPRAVIVCMIYFPLEAGLGQTSWADLQLKGLGYNWFPKQLQTAIRAMYEIATKKIKIDGTEVIPCALHEVLNGKNAGDYTDRVEPNDVGGRKMALRFVELLEGIVEVDQEIFDTTANMGKDENINK